VGIDTILNEAEAIALLRELLAPRVIRTKPEPATDILYGG